MTDAGQLLRRGHQALEAGEFGDAVAVFDELVRIAPRAAVAWCGRAAGFYGAGDLRRSLAAAQRAREIAPSDPRVYLVLGPPAFALGHAATIAQCRDFLRTRSRAEGREIACFWVRRLSDKDYFTEAAAAFDLLAPAPDDDFDLRFQRADILLNAFRLDDAEAAVAQAKALGAPIHGVEALSARIQLMRGELKGASVAAQRAIADKPDAILAYAILADVDPAAAGAEGAARLAACIADERLPTEKRIAGGIALGRIRESLGDIDGAFAAFCAAKKLAAGLLSIAGVRYDQRRTEAAMRRELALAPAAVTAGADPPMSPGLVFIVGMPRSGSTLIDQVLSRHSMVASVGESLAVVAHLRSEGNDALPTIAARMRFRAGYAKAAGSAKIVVDKNLFNFQHLRLIADLEPEARFILSTRDPMDVGLSIFRTNFMAAHPWANDLDDIAHLIACFEVIVDQRRQELDDRMFVARHEEFVADFEPHVRSLLEFCGLPFEAACLDFHEGKRAVFTQSAAQVRRPLNADGVERWRNYERHLAGFRESLARHRMRLGGGLL